MTKEEKIDQIQTQLDHLLQRQQQFQLDIQTLQKALNHLKAAAAFVEEPVAPIEIAPAIPEIEAIQTVPIAETRSSVEPELEEPTETTPPPPPKPAFDLEQYIGGNLINKVGMLILLIGLGLFVKFAVDKGFFPPIVRIILGYLAGTALTGIAYRLRDKYELYSAVLFGGGMAVMYFTTFIGYSFFDPPVVAQVLAFVLMLFFTAATVLVAYFYKHQIIGLLGLVGAYAVPLLLSTGSGNYLALLIYVTVINVGILVLAAKNEWRAMTRTAFVLTWLIVFGYFFNGLELFPGWLFSILTFQIFYLAFIAYQLRHRTSFSRSTLVFMIWNALFFYAYSLLLIEEGRWGERFAFCIVTTLNALIHFGVSYFLYLKLENKKPAIGLSILGIVLVGVATPIGFGPKMTLVLWMVQALILFRVARQYQIQVYQFLSFLLAGFTCFGLVLHWQFSYFSYSETFPFLFNVHFLTSLAIIAGIWFFRYLNQHYFEEKKKETLHQILTATFIGLIYFTFYNELYHWAEVLIQKGSLINLYQSVLLFNYTFLFLSILAWWNWKRWKAVHLDYFLLATGLFLILSFGLSVMPPFNQLGQRFLLEPTWGAAGALLFRYVSYFFIGLFCWVITQFERDKGLIWHPLLTGFIISLIYVTLLNELQFWVNHFIAIGSLAASFETIFYFDYTLLFLVVLAWWNRKYWKNKEANVFIIIGGLLLIGLFFLFAMPELNELRRQFVVEPSFQKVGYLFIRYLSYFLVGVLSWVIAQLLPQHTQLKTLQRYFSLILHGFILIALSNEVSTVIMLLTDEVDPISAKKIGYSILWGLYALFLIVMGIRADKKYWRWAGIGLLGVTLLKVFIWDLANLSTISRTIIFIGLGVLMLVTSYFYQRKED